MISVDEEFRFRPSFSSRNGRSVEFVVDASFALRLGIQSVTAAALGKDFQTFRSFLSQSEENVGFVVGAT